MIRLDNLGLRELVEPAGLVESIRAAMREANDGIFRGPRVIVDTYDGRSESRGLLDPVSIGALDATQVRDLTTLLRDATVARRDIEEITVFKAVSTANANLAVARSLLRCHHQTPTTGTGAIA